MSDLKPPRLPNWLDADAAALSGRHRAAATLAARCRGWRARRP